MALFAAAWVTLSVSQVGYAQRSVAEIRAAIVAGVDHLIAAQQPDGSWKEPNVQHGGAGYDVGRTALAVLRGRPKRVDPSSLWRTV